MKRAVVGFSLVLAACGVTSEEAGVDQQNSSGTQYVDIVDFAGRGFDAGAWFDVRGKLNTEFSAACAGSFCGDGAYANYTPLTFFCSVSSIEGSVKDCAWTFAASTAGVDARTAAISFDVPTFQCHIHPKTTAAKLEALLSASSDALHEPLPGTTSIADSLADCFANPIGSTPVVEVADAKPVYVSADDYYATATNRAKWAAAYAALKQGFDNICGDTYCSSDYSDLWSMQLVCSITKSDGNVKSCVWAFAGSYSTVKTSGALDVVSQAWQCPVAVKGTLSQLITTLTSTTDTTDPIQRPLPGVTTSAYDSLGGCLP